MTIVLNIIPEQVATESVPDCYFCGNGRDDDYFGVACQDCANEVFDFCEGCEAATYMEESNRWMVESTFSQVVARAHPGYGEAGATSDPLFPPRSFLPSAFGLGFAPRARVRTEDDPYVLTCGGCVTDCVEGCGSSFYDAENATECCAMPFSCPRCEEHWGSEQSARECCDSYLMRDYSYSPELRFWTLDGCAPIWDDGARDGTLYLGMELELEKARDGLENFLSNAEESPPDPPDFLWTKSDGSLSADGIELVTMPSTYQAFRRRFPFDALEGWRKDGARSYAYGSCGLHVHVSRSAFSASHLWRFVKWQLWNAPFCQLVAQREYSSYAQWSESGRIEEGHYLALPDVIKGKDSNRNRYVALNFQNDDTVELRYFKGNITKESILTKLAFVDSLFVWTKELTVLDCASGALRSPNAYLEWLTGQDYPELIAFLTKRERIV